MTHAVPTTIAALLNERRVIDPPEEFRGRALVRDDAEMRGIPASALLPEVEQISRAQLADFLNGFDMVWHW